MSILIVFRGNCNRYDNIDLIVSNFIKKIKLPLTNNNYIVDIILSTYKNELNFLEKFKKYLEPIFINLLDGQSTQKDLFFNTIKFIKNNCDYTKYEKIIFLRFDIIYKVDILHWNIFDKKGIFFPFIEDSEEIYNITKYHSDIIIAVDEIYFDFLYKTMKEFIPLCRSDGFPHFPYHILHNIGNLLNSKYTVPINYMFDGYYQSSTHPTIAVGSKLNPMFVNVRNLNSSNLNDYI